MVAMTDSPTISLIKSGPNIREGSAVIIAGAPVTMRMELVGKDDARLTLFRGENKIGEADLMLAVPEIDAEDQTKYWHGHTVLDGYRWQLRGTLDADGILVFALLDCRQPMVPVVAC